MKLFILAVSACILTGCASAQLRDTTYYNIKDINIPKDYNTCWQNLLDVLSDQNEPIVTIEKESGILVSDFVNISQDSLIRYALVPYGMMGTGYTEGRYKLNIRVKKISENVTAVKINAHIEGFWGIVQPYGWLALESRGVLEVGILQQLASKVGVELTYSKNE